MGMVPTIARTRFPTRLREKASASVGDTNTIALAARASGTTLSFRSGCIADHSCKVTTSLHPARLAITGARPGATLHPHASHGYWTWRRSTRRRTRERARAHSAGRPFGMRT